jgi:hypothetical protein
MTSEIPVSAQPAAGLATYRSGKGAGGASGARLAHLSFNVAPL